MKYEKKFEENDKKIVFTGERVVPNETPYYIFQEHINRYHFASNLTNNKVVLDVACGMGYGSDYLIKNGAKKVTGLDISEESIIYAKNNYKDSNLTFIVGDATKLPFENEHFDVIVSFETIEHIEEYNNFLNECKRVLKTGGIFICSTPNKRYTSEILKNSNPYHIIEFYPEDFQNLINEYFSSTKLYGQININVIRTKFDKFLGKLISIIPFYIKDRLKRPYSINYNDINEFYKVTDFQNTKLSLSEFVVTISKKISNNPLNKI